MRAVLLGLAFLALGGCEWPLKDCREVGEREKIVAVVLPDGSSVVFEEIE